MQMNLCKCVSRGSKGMNFLKKFGITPSHGGFCPAAFCALVKMAQLVLPFHS